MDLVEVFRFQARACQELGSPMYAALRDRMADDLAEGGAVLGTVLAGREDDPGPSALALRLVGGIHRQVLSGAAPELAAYFPSVGGVWHLDEAWPHIAALLRMRHDVLAPLLEHPPQTNEVGLRTARSFSTPRLARGGSSDAHVRIVERVGSDIELIDVCSEEGRLTLLSYVWLDQVQPARLRGAFEVARDSRQTCGAVMPCRCSAGSTSPPALRPWCGHPSRGSASHRRTNRPRPTGSTRSAQPRTRHAARAREPGAATANPRQ